MTALLIAMHILSVLFFPLALAITVPTHLIVHAVRSKPAVAPVVDPQALPAKHVPAWMVVIWVAVAFLALRWMLADQFG